MNDLDEFAQIAAAIFVALTFLIWLLTYLEQTLIEPVTENRARRRGVGREGEPSRLRLLTTISPASARDAVAESDSGAPRRPVISLRA